MRNVQWWERLCATIDAKDTRGFLAYLADDCEFRFANGPAVTGHEAIGAAVDAFWASIRATYKPVVQVTSVGIVTESGHRASASPNFSSALG